MSDSTVFQTGQSLRRREMLKATVAGTTAFGMAAASSGTVAADDDGIMPDPTVRHAFINPGIEALYNYVTTFGDDGYTQESVKEMSAENYKTRVYQGVDSTNRAVSGAVTNLENFVRPDDTTASPLAEMAYSVLRTTALEAVKDGKSITDARTEAVDAALDELTVPYRNTVHQWNEVVYDSIRYLFAYLDEEAELEWGGDSGDIDHASGEIQSVEIHSEDIDTSKDGMPSWPDPYYMTQSWDFRWPIEARIDELSAPNGEVVESYRFVWPTSATNISLHAKRSSSQSHPSDGSTLALRVTNPNGSNPNVAASYDLGIYRILNAIESIGDDVQANGGDIVEDIMSSYTAGDIGEMDILSSYDLVREYGDSNEMTRYTAELMAAGLDAQDDVTHAVTIDHPDTGERTGRLFLSWDWSELRGWEYDYDPEANSIQIDPASLDDDPDLTVVFDDDGTETEIELTADDLEDGFYDFEQDNGLLHRVERYSQGELRSHIPVGEETDHWNRAIFLHDDGDGGTNYVWLDTDEPFELVAVEDEDGNDLDKLELNGWENQERDPALSLQEAQRAEEQYVTVSELEETAHGGGGGGGTDTDALLIGGGIIALIGMIIAALSSGGS